MLRPRWNNGEIMPYQHWNHVETTLCNVRKPLDQRLQLCFHVGHRRCVNVVQRWKSDVGLCFISKVGSTFFEITLIQNVDPTLKCWLGKYFEYIFNSPKRGDGELVNTMVGLGISITDKFEDSCPFDKLNYLIWCNWIWDYTVRHLTIGRIVEPAFRDVTLRCLLLNLKLRQTSLLPLPFQPLTFSDC